MYEVKEYSDISDLQLSNAENAWTNISTVNIKRDLAELHHIAQTPKGRPLNQRTSYVLRTSQEHPLEVCAV